jgi:hypothetical protein
MKITFAGEQPPMEVSSVRDVLYSKASGKAIAHCSAG